MGKNIERRKAVKVWHLRFEEADVLYQDKDRSDTDPDVGVITWVTFT